MAGWGAPISQGAIFWYTELKKLSGSEPNLLTINLHMVFCYICAQSFTRTLPADSAEQHNPKPAPFLLQLGKMSDTASDFLSKSCVRCSAGEDKMRCPLRGRNGYYEPELNFLALTAIVISQILKTTTINLFGHPKYTSGAPFPQMD